MRTLVWIVCLLLLGNFCYAGQENYRHPIDKVEADLIAQELSTAGTANATIKVTEMWEEEMNKFCELLKQELNARERKQLIEAQEAWLKFREKEKQNIINVFGKLIGTMYIPMRAANFKALVRTRALDLRSYYELIVYSGPGDIK
ncbi:MAG: DUF1311 domain-containing protein [PVC group bacterium]|nr:DUF1311 domain-containing protein [PVC group bacterium]